MSLAKAAQFLANSATKTVSADTPESRLMQALVQRKTLKMTDIPAVTGLSPDRALMLVEQFRDSGKAVVLERPDNPALYLGLT